MVSIGKHRAVLIGGAATLTASQKKGTEGVAGEFQITQGEEKGETVPWTSWLTDKTSERTLQALRACGWKGNDLTDLTGLNQEVTIVVEHEENDGKTYAKVRFVNALAVPLDPSKAKALQARLAAQIAAAPIVNGAPPSNGVAADDDLPF